jgi:HIRAN domain
MIVSSRPTKKGNARRMKIPVVGLNYRVNPDNQTKLAGVVPVIVEFEREPFNPHDKNAIKVILQSWKPGFHIGYVPKDIAAKLAPQLDEGRVKVSLASLEYVDDEAGNGTMDVFLLKGK